MKDIQIAFGERLRKIRTQLKLTQKDMAELIGVSKSYFSEMEKGKNGPGYEILYNLCTNYQINPQYLFFGTSPQFISNESEGIQSDVVRFEDFGPFSDNVRELLWYMKHSKSLFHAVFANFQEYLIEKKPMIDKQIANSQEEEHT